MLGARLKRRQWEIFQAGRSRASPRFAECHQGPESIIFCSEGLSEAIGIDVGDDCYIRGDISPTQEVHCSSTRRYWSLIDWFSCGGCHLFGAPANSKRYQEEDSY